MKCDDDTFVRVDSVLEEAKKVPGGRSLYVGNINYHHKPLRNGKWAVTYEVYTISLSHTHTLIHTHRQCRMLANQIMEITGSFFFLNFISTL